MELEFIKNLITPVLHNNHAEFVGIFGSYARHEETETSDVDLLVRFSQPKSLIEIIRLERELSLILKKKVEIITEKSLHQYLAPYILRDLKVVYGERR